MSYKGEAVGQMSFEGVPEGQYDYKDVVAVYHVSVSFKRDGHACTSYGWVDMGSHLAISVKHECYETEGATRITALQLAQETARRAVLDETPGVD